MENTKETEAGTRQSAEPQVAVPAPENQTTEGAGNAGETDYKKATELNGSGVVQPRSRRRKRKKQSPVSNGVPLTEETVETKDTEVPEPEAAGKAGEDIQGADVTGMKETEDEKSETENTGAEETETENTGAEEIETENTGAEETETKDSVTEETETENTGTEENKTKDSGAEETETENTGAEETETKETRADAADVQEDNYLEDDEDNLFTKIYGVDQGVRKEKMRLHIWLFIVPCAVSILLLCICISIMRGSRQTADDYAVQAAQFSELKQQYDQMVTNHENEQMELEEAKNRLERETEEIRKNLPDIDIHSWEYILVNLRSAIPSDFTVTLAKIENGQQVDERIADSLKLMLAEGREAGLRPLVCSSFRSMKKQLSLFEEDMTALTRRGMSDVAAYYEARRTTNLPGESEHMTGLAVDIVGKGYQTLDSHQAESAEAKWLEENCAKYGFILRYPSDKESVTGIAYESWHFRYVGQEAAEYIMKNDLTLEEFVQLYEDMDQGEQSVEEKDALLLLEDMLPLLSAINHYMFVENKSYNALNNDFYWNCIAYTLSACVSSYPEELYQQDELYIEADSSIIADLGYACFADRTDFQNISIPKSAAGRIHFENNSGRYNVLHMDPDNMASRMVSAEHAGSGITAKMEYYDPATDEVKAVYTYELVPVTNPAETDYIYAVKGVSGQRSE